MNSYGSKIVKASLSLMFYSWRRVYDESAEGGRSVSELGFVKDILVVIEYCFHVLTVTFF